MRKSLFVLCLLLAVAPLSAGEDPTKVDSKHYKVVFENDDVRVVRITYGPREKSVMHYHPEGVAVFLTDMTAQFTMPDGLSQVVEAKAGDTVWSEAGEHNPENLADKPLELIQVELKDDD